ncbi:MAG: helix-turn-helix domain-containing protein [Gemmatimonadota bacterium]|nr:helix-turn-helix domain-containing protein [Gemmatimonadota bacterium]
MTTPIKSTIPLPVLRLLRKLGNDIRDARLRRRIRAATLAERALISRTTLHRIERGAGGVSMGNYATVLFVLGLHDGISELADRGRDALGLDLMEERLPQRVRVPRASAGPGPTDGR